MWTPIKVKEGTSPRWKSGWYCHDQGECLTDPSKRYSGKQSAQKECDRRNGVELVEATDGKTRNPKKWFTIGYVDRSWPPSFRMLSSTIQYYHGYLSELLRETVQVLQNGNIQGAEVAVIWAGHLSRRVAIYGANAIPIRHVFADGRITGATA